MEGLEFYCDADLEDIKELFLDIAGEESRDSFYLNHYLSHEGYYHLSFGSNKVLELVFCYTTKTFEVTASIINGINDLKFAEDYMHIVT